MEKKQYKRYKSSIKFIDETKGIVVVAANAFNNIDSQGDVSLPGSFAKTIENIKNIYWYKNHDTYETLGIVQRLWEDDIFLNAEMKFNLDKEISRNMYSDYRFFQEHNNEIKHSVGVSAVQKDFKENIMYVKEWRLWEISSLTQWPANELAGTHEVKSLEHVETIEKYFEWMSKKGVHTEEFIRDTETLLDKLRLQLQIIEPVIEPLKKSEEPDYSTLIKSINEFKI